MAECIGWPPSRATTLAVSAFVKNQRLILRRVASGEQIEITQRGNIVAVLVPPDNRRPRLLPDGVNTCPTCGATTDHDAEVLNSIHRVSIWKDQTKDREGIAIYDACLAELRGLLKTEPVAALAMKRDGECDVKAPVAQVDSASESGSGGCEFESRSAHETKTPSAHADGVSTVSTPHRRSARNE